MGHAGSAGCRRPRAVSWEPAEGRDAVVERGVLQAHVWRGSELFWCGRAARGGQSGHTNHRHRAGAPHGACRSIARASAHWRTSSIAHPLNRAPAQSRTSSLAHPPTRAPAQSLASSDPSTRVPVASRPSSRWASFCPAARITPVARCSTRCGCQMTHRRSAAARSRRLNTHGLPWSRGSSSRAWLPPGCPSSGGGEPSGM